MTNNTYVRYVINFALLTCAVVLAAANGLDLRSAMGIASGVGSAVFVGLLAFENFAWKLPWLQHQRWFPMPDLSGTWQGELLSNWKKEPEDPKLPPIETYFVIRQTFSWISARQYTKESESVLVSGGIRSEPDGVKRLIGVYRNEPRFEYRPPSTIHYGAMNYAIPGRPVTCVEGYYWTDRTTDGTVCFLQRVPETADGFTDAQSRFTVGVEVAALPEESTVS